MKIYTKTGDAGETGLFGNVRVPKDDHRIRTYGTIDELNATLGLALSEPGVPSDLAVRIRRIQGELFQLGAELATPRKKSVPTAVIDESHVAALESEIDQMESRMPELKTFVLPGGIRLASLLHLARTVSRRAERELTGLHRAEPCRTEVLSYVNRLSDYFFVTARYANHLANVPDIPWVAPKAKL
jgi:cob(I)alamin adenosyltransferase